MEENKISYFSKFNQDIRESANNTAASPVTNIAGGATWTGTADSTLSVAGIQVTVFADQNCTVYVDQSPNTTPNWDITDEYNYYANTSFGITVQAVGAQFRVRVKNLNATTATSTLRITSILCPIVEAVPRSLDDGGNFKVAIKSMEDEYGFEIENTPTGEMRTVIPQRLVGAAFSSTVVDPNFWTVTNTGSGTATEANAEIVLSPGGVANGASVVNSVRRGRYVSGSGMIYRSIIVLSAGAANNKRRWGIAYGATMPTITDGAWFQLDGTTFSIVTARATVQTKVDSGSFNGSLGATYDPSTTVKTYEIYWTNSKVYFVIGGRILHTVTASTTTWSATMSNYIYMDTVNSSGISTLNTLTCRVASIRRLGPLETLPIHKYQSGTTAGVICKYSAGTLRGIVISNVSNNSVVTIYDGTTTGGTVVWASGAMGASTTPFDVDFKGMPFYNGLFFTITGAACNLLVIYE